MFFFPLHSLKTQEIAQNTNNDNELFYSAPVFQCFAVIWIWFLKSLERGINDTFK